MIKEVLAASWVAVGLFVLGHSQSTETNLEPGLLGLLFVLALGSEFVQLTPWGKGFARTLPLIGFLGIAGGRETTFLAAISILVGSIALGALHGLNASDIIRDTIRSLAPMGSVLLLHQSLPQPLDKILTILVFVLFAVVYEPNCQHLRSTLNLTLAAPWIALAVEHQSKTQSWLIPFSLAAVVPLCIKDKDSHTAVERLKRALYLTRQHAQVQTEKAKKYSSVLRGAGLMSKCLEQNALISALEKSAESCGARQAKAEIPSTSPEQSGGIPLLAGKGRLHFKGQADEATLERLQILARVFATCWENVSLHAQVVEALEETKRSQAQLVESNRLAAMGLVAAGVAHEVNSPLAALQLSTEIVESHFEENPEIAKKQLKAMFRAIDKARKAVERTLHYARPSDGENTYFELSEVLDDALALLSHRISRSEVEVETELEQGLQLCGDSHAFFSLVFNLILNAVEATEQTPRPGQVLVRLGSSGTKIVLQIEDNGEGVPLELQDKIFEPFFTTRPLGEGTGLGLHLASRAASELGGQLSLHQSPGPGAVFRVDFCRQV